MLFTIYSRRRLAVVWCCVVCALTYAVGPKTARQLGASDVADALGGLRWPLGLRAECAEAVVLDVVAHVLGYEKPTLLVLALERLVLRVDGVLQLGG